ncbi:MAG: hypothetical protein WDN24_02565 [Sphingomonas sp.]
MLCGLIVQLAARTGRGDEQQRQGGRRQGSRVRGQAADHGATIAHLNCPS